jgi:hypothetical protein
MKPPSPLPVITLQHLRVDDDLSIHKKSLSNVYLMSPKASALKLRVLGKINFVVEARLGASQLLSRLRFF